MTITAGNSNNGIPMGGYVPGTGSGGGGTVSGNVYKYKGSVDSYDLLPTMNLETGDVYNVADTGMNYAWTGAEWDALGATVDLSAYYDKTEVDAELVKKQDVLTPALPLEINTKQINASNNMTVQETGDIVSSNSAWSTNPNADKTTFNYNTGEASGEYLFVRNASFNAVQKQLGCMVFPFTFGHIYTVPICADENRNTVQPPAIALGYYNSEAEFVPVLTTTTSVDEWAQFTTTTAVETEPRWDVWGFTTSSDGVYTNRTSLGQPVEPWIPGHYTLYFQIFKTPEGNYSFTNAPHYANHLRCYTGDFISTMNPLLNKCTHIMLCAWSTDDAGVGVNNGIGAPAYNLSSNTFDFVYSGNLAEDIEANIFDYQNLKATSENLFKLEAFNTTSLTLNIDNNTLKVNDSGQLYAESSAPTNMVTTDTEQTITAKKVHTGATEFQREVTFHTDSSQCLMFKTSNKSAIAGIKCVTVSGNDIALDFGGVDGESNVTPRFICESDAQITNISGYNWGRILDTRNFNSRILAGDNITITKNGSGLDSTYTIASTASGGGSYTLPAATADTLGGIKVGSNLAVTDDGTLSATYIPATTASLGVVKPDGTTITVDEDGTIHSTQEGFADLAANNVFTGTNQFQSTVTVGNGFNTAVLNMGPGSGLIFNNSSQAGGKTLSLGTQTGTQVTIYSDGVPIIQRSETRTNQSSSDDNPYTKYDNVDSGNINDILGVSFWKGTQTEYDGITEKDANTLYIITG